MQAAGTAKFSRTTDEMLLRLQTLDGPIVRIDERVAAILESVDAKEEQTILDWISPVLYSSHHDMVSESRMPDTCDWLLQHPKYQEWRSSSGCALLWLQGSVGTGKTFLTSKVIDDQRALLDSGPNDEAIAFFYFNRSELSRSSALACLRSLVRQFSTCHTGHGRIQPTLRNLYNSCRRDARTLSKELCKKQLAESLKLFPRSILVLDALDECLHESDRLELVMTLKALMEESPRPFQVFISGRPNGDIRDALRGCTSVEIKVDDNKDDIAKFVNEKVKNHRGWRDFSQETKKTVIDTLIAKGQAMSVPLKALSCSLPGLVLTHQSESALGFAGYIFKFTSCQRDAWSRKYFFDFNSCPKTLKPHTQKYTHSRSRPVARLSQGSPNVPSCGLWRL